MTFGEYVRSKRLDQGYTLREFCKKYQHDPSNWSKIERDILQPPADDETLSKWAEQLGIKKDDKEWSNLFDLAYISRGGIPSDLLSDEELVEKLPLFFRTMRGEKPTNKELDALIKLLRNKK